MKTIFSIFSLALTMITMVFAEQRPDEVLNFEEQEKSFDLAAELSDEVPLIALTNEADSMQGAAEAIQERSSGDWLDNYLQTVDNYQNFGSEFKWYSQLLKDPAAFKKAIQMLADRYRKEAIDVIVALDPRGFVFGTALSYELEKPLVLIRKAGKLPGNVVTIQAGSLNLEIEKTALKPGEQVLLIDDMFTSADAMQSASFLIEELGAHVAHVACLIEYNAFHGRDKLSVPVFSLVQVKEKNEWVYEFIQKISDFPVPGVQFKSFCPLLKDPIAFKKSVKIFTDHLKDIDFDAIVGIESRGYILATAIAYEMGKPLYLVRKAWDLPVKVVRTEYALEYGSNVVEIDSQSIEVGQKVILVDDVIATGGTLAATCDLITQMGGVVVEAECLMELSFLKGRQKLSFPLFSVLNLRD